MQLKPQLVVTSSAARLHLWRAFPREVADIICSEATVIDWPLHAHEAFQVLLPNARLAILDGRGGRIVVGPGSVYVAAPLELYGVRSLGNSPPPIRLMLVAHDELTSLAPAGGQFVIKDAGAFIALGAIFEELRGPLVALDCEARLRECLCRLLASPMSRLAHRTPDDERRVERVRDYLRAHPSESVSLDGLAGIGCLSKFYLLRAFRRAYGMTPHAYQMQLRLARAARLIADEVSLSAAAYDAGFADQSHLTRRFKAAFGLAPGQFARQLTVVPRRRSALRAAPAPQRGGPPPSRGLILRRCRSDSESHRRAGTWPAPRRSV